MTFGGNTRSNIIKLLSIKMVVTLYSSNIYFKFTCLEKLNIDYRIRVHFSFPTESKPIAEIKVLFSPTHTITNNMKKEAKQIQTSSFD